MSNHVKKIIAPVIVTICVLAYFIMVAVILLIVEFSIFIKMIIIVFSLILIATAVYVLLERIKEIKSGEEDDLGKY